MAVDDLGPTSSSLSPYGPPIDIIFCYGIVDMLSSARRMDKGEYVFINNQQKGEL